MLISKDDGTLNVNHTFLIHISAAEVIVITVVPIIPNVKILEEN